MKKLIVLAITFLTLQSCVTYPVVEGHFAIVNNSGKDVEISSYQIDIYHNATIKKKFAIINNNKYEQTLGGFTVDLPFTFEQFVRGDSISIDYGDKVQGYSNFKSTSTNEARNPYTLVRDKKPNDFVYTLTPEDYANATPKP